VSGAASSPSAGVSAPGKSTIKPRFASVVLDVDSTLAGIEGIDRLAAKRGPDVAARVSELTDRAMRGEIALESVYGERIALIRPTWAEVDQLAQEYIAAMAPGAAESLAAMRGACVRIAVVSGGLREAILPLARRLYIPPQCVFAVSIAFTERGEFDVIDSSSPLTTQTGKAEIVRHLALSAPVLAVGDGATDLAMKPAVDAFAAYTGFVRREAVVAVADFEIDSFERLTALVLS
jgi:phosphoserine phosphatase